MHDSDAVRQGPAAVRLGALVIHAFLFKDLVGNAEALDASGGGRNDQAEGLIGVRGKFVDLEGLLGAVGGGIGERRLAVSVADEFRNFHIVILAACSKGMDLGVERIGRFAGNVSVAGDQKLDVAGALLGDVEAGLVVDAVLTVGIIAEKELRAALGCRGVVGNDYHSAGPPPAAFPVVLVDNIAGRVAFARFKIDREDRVGLPGQNAHYAEGNKEQ